MHTFQPRQSSWGQSTEVGGGLGLVWGLPRRLPKQIPGLGFWTDPPHPTPPPCLPALSCRAGAFKSFFLSPFPIWSHCRY